MTSKTISNSGTYTSGYSVTVDTVVNYGLIGNSVGAALYSAGVAPFDVDNHGTIAGPSGGIGILFRGGTLTNEVGGTITGGNFVIRDLSGSVGATLINAGYINRTVYASSGLRITPFANVAVTNEATGTIAIAGWGLRLGSAQYALSVTNAGTMLADGYVIDAQAAGSLTTITNHGGGVISSVGTALGTASVGIQLSKGGRVINEAGGTISGYYGITDTGVAPNTNTTTIDNAGTISSTGTGGKAILLSPAGSFPTWDAIIMHPGAVFNGVVDGGTDATHSTVLYLAGGAGVGTITGLGTSFINLYSANVVSGASWVTSGDNAGIRIEDRGLVTNTGSLSQALSVGDGGTFINTKTGISAEVFSLNMVSAGTVVNRGTLYGAENASVGGSGFNGSRVLNLGHGLINGLVYFADGTVINKAHATITGQAHIASTAGLDPSIIRNHGVINGVVRFDKLGAGGTIVNAAGGLISGSSVAITRTSSDSGLAVIINAGTITSSGVAIQSVHTPGPPVTIRNMASGLISASYGIVGATRLVNAGTIIGTGGPAVTMDTDAPSTVVVKAGGVFSGGVTAHAGSVLKLEPGSGVGTISGLGSDFVGFGDVSVQAGADFVVSGTVDGVLHDLGTVEASGQLTASGGISGNGTIDIMPGATLSVSGMVTSATMSFLAGSGETLQLEAPKQFAGTIANFGAGDTIDLVGVGLARGVSYDAGAGLLTVVLKGAAALAFDIPGALTTSDFVVSSDGNHGTLLTHT